MKKYIMELHKKPLHHKKRFALLTAGSTTLVIFAFWSAIMFAAPSKVVESADTAVNLAAVPTSGVTPFQNIFHGIESSWLSLTKILTNGGN
ncbi:hypothetical protein KW800_02630 [Candidatus Parcubacteria bacterium]|nr:hypothetical protein [Candidatus Parcubacteria bacterium]